MKLRSILLALILVVLAAGATQSTDARPAEATTFVLRAVPPRGYEVTPRDLQRAVFVMRDRAAALGDSHAEIRSRGSDRIVVRLTRGADSRTTATTLARAGRLAFYDLEPSLVRGVPVASQDLRALLARARRRAISGTPTAYYLFRRGKPIASAPTIAQLGRDPAAARVLRGRDYQILPVPKGTVVVSCSSATAVVCPARRSGAQPPKGVTYYYIFELPPSLTGDDVDTRQIRRSVDPTTGESIVTLKFTPAGNRAFRAVTRRETVRGVVRRSPQHLAIVVDGEVRAFPQIDYGAYPNGIDPSAGGAQLTGLVGPEGAKRLVVTLRTGPLPVPFVVVSR